MNKTVGIVFIDKTKMFDSPVFVSNKKKQFLQSNPSFEYNDEYRVRDFYRWIIQNTEENPIPQVSDDHELIMSLKGELRGKIDDEFYKLNLDFPFAKYVWFNSIDGILYFQYNIGIGGGWFGNFSSSIKIYINSDEQRHNKSPHVHVQKGKYNRIAPHSNTIRIALDDKLTVLDERNLKDILSKKESVKVKDFLYNHRELFIDNFNKIVKGAKPEEVWLDTDNGEILFR